MKELSVVHHRIAVHRWVGAAVALALVLLVVPQARADDARFLIIVHPDNPADSVTRSEVSQMLLKKQSRWAHGASVEPVDLQAGSPTRASFSRDVHGRSVSSIKEYQRQIFSGDGVPPPELASDSAVMIFVRSRPGAIGYVSASAKLGGVKELKISD